MKIVFMGSPDFAAIPLRRMIENNYPVAAVFSQPDRARGRRGKEMLPTAVKQTAFDLGLPVFTPENINSEQALAQIKGLQPDLLVVVAYGQILSSELLAIPSEGAINIHGSLLPKYRGAAPIQRALMNGESKSGVSIMYLDSGMDSGDIIAKEEIDLDANETYGSLYNKLCDLGSELLLQVLGWIEKGIVKREPQNHQAATYAPKISKDELLVSWEADSAQVHNHIRSLDPFPGAYIICGNRRFKVFGSSIAAGEGKAGEIIAIDDLGMVIACAKGAVRISTVQPAGKKKMPAADCARGYQMNIGGELR